MGKYLSIARERLLINFWGDGVLVGGMESGSLFFVKNKPRISYYEWAVLLI
jgi:hypothetical protein